MFSPYEFSKFFWGGAHRAPSPDPSPRSISGFDRRFSGACIESSSSGCALNSPLQHGFDKPLSQPRCTRPEHCFPQTPTFWLHHRPNISFQALCSWITLKYTRLKMILDGMQAGIGFSENPAWWTRHTGTYSTRNYLPPEAEHFSHMNAPKSLAAGAPPQTPYWRELTSAPPDPIAVMGWDWRFGNNFFWAYNYVPPCLWPVPPCCFEAGYSKPGRSHDLERWFICVFPRNILCWSLFPFQSQLRAAGV